jgi:hypothetical protein
MEKAGTGPGEPEFHFLFDYPGRVTAQKCQRFLIELLDLFVDRSVHSSKICRSIKKWVTNKIILRLVFGTSISSSSIPSWSAFLSNIIFSTTLRSRAARAICASDHYNRNDSIGSASVVTAVIPYESAGAVLLIKAGEAASERTRQRLRMAPVAESCCCIWIRNFLGC